MPKQKVYSKTIIIDDDGKVRQEVSEFKYEKEGLFAKMYLRDIDRLLDLDGSYKTVLLMFVKYMNSSNIVKLVDVCEDGRFSASYIRNRVKGLVDSGYLFRLKRGKYQVDLNLFSQTNYKRNLELKK